MVSASLVASHFSAEVPLQFRPPRIPTDYFRGNQFTVKNHKADEEVHPHEK